MIDWPALVRKAVYIGTPNEPMIETVNINKPIGVDTLPTEWEQKLGTYEFQTAGAVEVENVDLCGPAMVGFIDGDVVLDTAYFGRIDLWERNKPYFDYAMEALSTPNKTVSYAVSFANIWSHNYFHWVLDIMPSLEYILTLDERPLILVQQNPPDYMTGTLDDLGLAWEEQQADHYLVERLLVIPTRREKGFVKPSAIRILRNFALPTPPVFTSPYIYTSRDDASSRQVVNEEDVVGFLGGFGFHPLQAGKYDFSAQMGMFSQAREIIGPHGSALANMVWADAPKVIELVSPEYTNPCCWLIAAGMGWDYGYVIGEPSDKGHEFIEIDVTKLEQVMEMMECP